MRFLAYADIHFHHAWPEFNPVTPSGRSRWLEIQIDVWKQIHQYAEQFKVEGVLFAGDLTHKRSFVHTTVNNTILDLYKEAKIREAVISGNHDRYDQRFNAVQAISKVGKVVVASSEPEVFITTFEAVDVYGCEPGAKPPPLHFASAKCNILLAHGQLQGATTQSGFELSTGYSQADFAAYDLVILGDIHKKQIHGNVLIPGAPLQQSWGDKALKCGCWLIDTEAFDNSKPAPLDVTDDYEWKRIQTGNIGVMFLPIKAPRFIEVTQQNFDTIIKQTQPDTFNYYDFRLVREIDKQHFKELKRLFPYSYITVRKEEKTHTQVTLSARKNSSEEILDKFYDLRLKGKSKEEFQKLALQYLQTAAPKQLNTSYKNLEIEYIKAQNFMTFKEVLLDFRSLEHPLYQVSGLSDEETSSNNGVGKSTLAIEILCFVLYDKLARSTTRSKDRLIHRGEKGGLLGEVGLKIGNQRTIIQRYRKHSVLGTGSRILCQKLS